jgi:hypothetical protein
MRKAYTLIGKTEGRFGVGGSIILEWILNKQSVEM